MLLWLGAILTLALLAGLVFFEARRQEAAVRRDWDLVLTPKGRHELERAQDYVSAELGVMDDTYARAESAHSHGEKAEALKLLDIGCSLIEHYAPHWLDALSAMAALSRMVAAIAPVKPLIPRSFQLRELTQLALVHRFLHHLLVTSVERFRLRLTILQRGFTTVRRVVFQSTRRAHQKPHAIGPELAQLEAARSDIHTLSKESLESLRMFLEGLAAEKR